MTLALLFLCSLEFRVLQCVDLCHLRESHRGQDVKSRPGVIGPKGERGQYQLRPIFIDEIQRLHGWRPDPDNVQESQTAAFLWILHYSKQAERQLGRKISIHEMRSIYRYGYEGWMEPRRRKR